MRFLINLLPHLRGGNGIHHLLGNIRGATAIEYGLIAALIAVAAIAAMQGLGNSLKGSFNRTSSSIAVTSA